jgi:hypothetical protein
MKKIGALGFVILLWIGAIGGLFLGAWLADVTGFKEFSLLYLPCMIWAPIMTVSYIFMREPKKKDVVEKP